MVLTPNFSSAAASILSVSSMPSRSFATSAPSPAAPRPSSRLSLPGNNSFTKRSSAYLCAPSMSRSARRRTFSTSARASKSWFQCCSAFACASCSVSSNCSWLSPASAWAPPAWTSAGFDFGVVAWPSSVLILRYSPLLVLRKKPQPPSRRGRLPICGSLPEIQGGTEQLGGDVDQRNHPFVRHARGPDHAQHAQRPAARPVGRGHHAAIAQHFITRFIADEDLHAVAVDALIQQMQNVALLRKGLEQLTQHSYIREFGKAHEIGLTREHVVALARPLLRLLRHVPRGLQQGRGHVLPLQHGAPPAATPLGQRRSCVFAVEVAGRLRELRRAEAPFGANNVVLHLTVVDDEDREHAVRRQGDEFHMAQDDPFAPRHRHQPRHLRHARKQSRGAGQQFGDRRLGGELALELPQLVVLEELHAQQGIDEDAITLRGRNTPRRGVGRGHEAEVLEIGHDVADGSRTQIQVGAARERARAHRLAVADVTLDQGLEQLLRTFVELGRTHVISPAFIPSTHSWHSLYESANATSRPHRCQGAPARRRRGWRAVARVLTKRANRSRACPINSCPSACSANTAL